MIISSCLSIKDSILAVLSFNFTLKIKISKTKLRHTANDAKVTAHNCHSLYVHYFVNYRPSACNIEFNDKALVACVPQVMKWVL